MLKMADEETGGGVVNTEEKQGNPGNSAPVAAGQPPAASEGDGERKDKPAEGSWSAPILSLARKATESISSVNSSGSAWRSSQSPTSPKTEPDTPTPGTEPPHSPTPGTEPSAAHSLSHLQLFPAGESTKCPKAAYVS